MPDKMLRKLSNQQIRFCENYLIYFQPKKAAREAGFNEDYSYALLRNPLIKEYLKLRSADIMSQINEEQFRVFRELMNFATSDIRQLYDKNGNLLPLEKWPEQIAKCVSSVKHTKHPDGKKSLEVRLWNKNQALENLARVVGLLTSDVNINLPENVGAVYFPRPKPEGAPVDSEIVERDRKLQLHPGGMDEKEDKT